MLVKALEPQIVIADFKFDSTGKIFAKQIKSQHPRAKIVWYLGIIVARYIAWGK
jgi:hypothetical protein